MEPDEWRPGPEPFGPLDLARAVLTWIAVAIATLVTVWLLVFAATKGDELGFGIAVGVIIALGAIVLLRRRR